MRRRNAAISVSPRGARRSEDTCTSTVWVDEVVDLVAIAEPRVSVVVLCRDGYERLVTSVENPIHGRDSGGPAVTLKWCSRW
jgi:hypothetical protein